MTSYEHPAMDRLCAAIAARQDGVISVAQMRDAGLGRAAIDFRAATGRIHRVHRGVWAWGHPKLGERGLLWAAHLATGGVISHQSAAWAWGLLSALVLPVHVIVPRRRRKRQGVRPHECTTLRPQDVDKLDGLPITCVARTLDDLPHRLRRRATREARFLRLLPGESGPRVRSGLEHRYLDVIEDLALPRPLVNAVVDGRERDFYWPDHALVVEIDGGQHDRGAAPTIDRRRDRDLLVRTGIRTVRFDATDTAQDVAQTLRPLLVP